MKNRLLPLFVILGSISAYSQVGVGTFSPNKSTQLEVFSNDKGMLIPRVKLTSTTDTVTITNGNVNSLLVFATETTADIRPGYYYWYDEKWNRIVIAGESGAEAGTVIYNPITNQFTYIDDKGNTHIINISDIIKANEVITTITSNGSGSYVYKNEAGTEVTIDVINDVADNFQTIVNNPAVTEIIQNIVNKTEGNVSYNATTQEFTYIDSNGDSKVINISDLVKLNETVTTIAANGSGSYVYKNEAGTEVTIDVINDVADNFQTIVNNPAVTEIIQNIVNKTEGNVSYNATTQEFSYTDNSGNSHVINISDLVKLNETVTTIDAKGSGSYVYKNEAGTEVTIDVINDVADNFQTIVNNPAVTEIIQNIVNKTEGNVSYNATTQEFTYIDSNGDSKVINISDLVKLNETVTTIAANGSGSYVYKNEAGTEVTIDVINDVADNFQTIVNYPAVTEIIQNIVNKTEGNVSYNATTQEFTYIDSNGDSKVINISDLVKLNETVTTIAANGSGSYVYKNEAGTEVTIDVINDVADNFQTIVKNPAVTEIIQNIVNKTEGNVSYNATTQEFTYIDSNGDSKVINIADFVKLNETETTIRKTGSGSYIYKNEKEKEVTIDVINDVADNFQTIVNNEKVKQIIENIVTNTGGNVSYDGVKNEFTYIDSNGDSKVINIADFVKLNETETTIRKTGSGSYIYKNEKEKEVTIDVINDVADNFQTIVNNEKVKQIIENIVTNTGGNVSYDGVKNEFTYIDSNGDSKVINIADFVKLNETETTIRKTGSGSYIYKNEKEKEVTIDVINDVADNFQTIVNNEKVKQIIENIVTNTGGNVSYDGVKNEFTYIDANGDSKVINIADFVKLNETETTIRKTGSGSYIYKNEKEKEVTIDVINDVADNFQTIVNNEKVKQIIENIVTNTGGNVSYDGVKNEFTYIDANGNSKVINIADLVKLNETLTSLTFDTSTKKLIYKDEKGDTKAIDISTVVTVPQQAVEEFTPTKVGQTSFSLNSTPSDLSAVKLFINGVRIDKNAISLSGNTVIYTPENNGSYAVMLDDIIQIDYLK